MEGGPSSATAAAAAAASPPLGPTSGTTKAGQVFVVVLFENVTRFRPYPRRFFTTKCAIHNVCSMFVADRRTFMPNAKKGRFEEIAGGGFLAAASWWGLDEVQQAPEAGRVESDVALL